MEQRPLDAADTRLLESVADFGARNAVNGTYIGQFYLKSQSAPVLVVVAMGDQAMAIQQILMSAAVPDDAALIERAKTLNGKPF